MRRLITSSLSTIALIFLVAGVTRGADTIDRSKASPVREMSPVVVDEIRVDKADDPGVDSAVQKTMSGSNYNCQLRIFMNEPLSRWLDNTNFFHFQYGFLDFAMDAPISVPYSDTYTDTIRWDVPAEFGSVEESNIAATAVVFNLDNQHTAYSDPPNGSPYTAYYVDATALATPGNPGADISTENSTHTVFIEESTGHY